MGLGDGVAHGEGLAARHRRSEIDVVGADAGGDGELQLGRLGGFPAYKKGGVARLVAGAPRLL